MARPLAFGVFALDEPLAEIAHEANFYLTHGGPKIRDRFLDEVESALRRIADTPRSFRAWPKRPGVRRVALGRFPLAIGFVLGPPGSTDPPLVVVVSHHRRRPGYWFARLEGAVTKRRRR